MSRRVGKATDITKLHKKQKKRHHRDILQQPRLTILQSHRHVLQYSPFSVCKVEYFTSLLAGNHCVNV